MNESTTGPRDPSELSKNQLEHLVRAIQYTLYTNAHETRWELERTWTREDIEWIATLLRQYLLTPPPSINFPHASGAYVEIFPGTNPYNPVIEVNGEEIECSAGCRSLALRVLMGEDPRPFGDRLEEEGCFE